MAERIDRVLRSGGLLTLCGPPGAGASVVLQSHRHGRYLDLRRVQDARAALDGAAGGPLRIDVGASDPGGLLTWLREAPRWAVIAAARPLGVAQELVEPISGLSGGAARARLCVAAGMPTADSDPAISALLHELSGHAEALHAAGRALQVLRPDELLRQLTGPVGLRTLSLVEGPLAAAWAVLVPEEQAALRRLAALQEDFASHTAIAALSATGAPQVHRPLLRLFELGWLHRRADGRFVLPRLYRRFLVEHVGADPGGRAAVAVAMAARSGEGRARADWRAELVADQPERRACLAWAERAQADEIALDLAAQVVEAMRNAPLHEGAYDQLLRLFEGLARRAVAPSRRISLQLELMGLWGRRTAAVWNRATLAGLLEEACALGDPGVEAELLRGMLSVQARLSDAPAPLCALVEMIRERTSDPECWCITCGTAGSLLQTQGSFQEAEVYLVEGIQLARKNRYPHQEAFCRYILAGISADQGDIGRARETVVRCSALFRAQGDTVYATASTVMESVYTAIGSPLPPERIEAVEQQVRALHQEASRGAMLSLVGLVWLAVGDAERAAALLREGTDLWPPEAEMFGVHSAEHHAVINRVGEMLWAAPVACLPAPTLPGLQDAARRFDALSDLHTATQAPAQEALSQIDRVRERVGAPVGVGAGTWLAHLARTIALRAADASVKALVGRGVLLYSVDPPAFWFREAQVSLARRPVLARLFLTLVEARCQAPRSARSAQQLIRAVWPEQRTINDSARKRLYVAIVQLRKAGLGTAIATGDGGYSINPATEIALLDPWP